MMMIKHPALKQAILCLFLFLSGSAVGQSPGDEDNEMFNKAQVRDQKEIDRALNGWWKTAMLTHDRRIQWWRDAKFGMFIHWGVYSLAGGEWKGKHVSGYSEHLMRKEKISKSEYLELAHRFNPQQFNAEKWITAAKNAGMNYFIITAKHHDGFAMYPSNVSDFNIANQTVFKRDPLAELAAAARKHGIKFGFYYSHAFDWEDPNAPGNDWEYKNPGGDQLIGGARWFDQHPEWVPKAIKYVNEKAIPQIQELITKYHPDILWFDTPHKLPFSENLRILETIRKMDPNIVVNGRLARNGSKNYGDYQNTGDRPAEFAPVGGDWEAIPTTNESYGYSKNDDSHKPAGFFVQLLAKAVSRGGNLLLNIGPMGDGSFDPKDAQILESIAVWNKKNAKSIYKATKTSLPLQSWGVTTLGQNCVYLHVFNWPSNRKLSLAGLNSSIGNPYFLEDSTKKAIKTVQKGSEIIFDLPFKMPDSLNTVIVLPLKSTLRVDSLRLVATSGLSTRLLAFDANLTPNGFTFGDGKTNRYYVDGWKRLDQKVSWNFKTTQPGSYKILISYIPSNGTPIKYSFQSDEVKYTRSTLQAVKNSIPVTEEIGPISLGSGLHTFMLQALELPQTEVMKLLEIQIVPLK